MIGWIFALSGAAAGAAQAGLLGRTVRCGLHPLGTLTRVGLVPAVLVLAARTGHLAPGAVGWLAGFVIAAAIVHRMLR